MTEQKPEAPAAPPAGGGSPTRGAGPSQPPAETPNILLTAEGAEDDGPGLSSEEETELARLQAKAAGVQAGQEAVELKVEPPHVSMYHANVTLGREFSPVNPALVPAIESAAAAAGVKLTRKE